VGVVGRAQAGPRRHDDALLVVEVLGHHLGEAGGAGRRGPGVADRQPAGQLVGDGLQLLVIGHQAGCGEAGEPTGDQGEQVPRLVGVVPAQQVADRSHPGSADRGPLGQGGGEGPGLGPEGPVGEEEVREGGGGAHARPSPTALPAR
jgi:hypothetical protein